jgi:hypothetical protein
MKVLYRGRAEAGAAEKFTVTKSATLIVRKAHLGFLPKRKKLYS